MAPLLEAKNVTKVFGSGPRATLALDNFSLAVSDDKPSFTAVAGESGSGKTTLARLLLGFAQPTSGDVLYRGKRLGKMSGGEWRQFRREVQAIFQDPFEVFNPFYKVDHLLTVSVAKFDLAKSKAEARSRIEAALATVGLRPDETLGRYPHQLSGGQRQRLTIARALLLNPRLIIADEPVSMVDASLRATILESLRKLHTEFGISFLYITHDLTTAYQISDNIIILYRGSVAEVGDIELVIKQPQHPYSRLLIASIPEPDVDLRWSDERAIRAGTEIRNGASHGCKFAERCPLAMPMCTEKIPPLFRTDESRAASCFLFSGTPTISPDKMNSVFVQRAPAESSR
jgi:peptide/nickel transport system ATP-binding protein